MTEPNEPEPNESEPNEPEATSLRRGNPFAEGSMRDTGGLSSPDAAMMVVEEVWLPESGVLKSCVTASAAVLVFAALCYAMFPSGGVAVAGLGAGLSIIGLFSNRTIAAAILLAAHVSLFASCYLQLWNG